MRTATWTKIGTDIRDCGNDIDHILEKSNLDYEVSKSKIFLPNGVEIPDKVATVKGDGTYIGVVSPNYAVYQNREAFDFISEIPNIQLLKAGETHNGLVYMIGKLPDMEVLHDKFEPYVIFQTSHNGMFNVKATICPLRFVCQNQFATSFRGIKNTIDVRHSSLLPTKIAQAQTLLKDTAIYMQGFTNTAEELAMLKIGGTDNVYRIIDAFFDSTREITERQQKAIMGKKEFFMECYEAEDNSDFRGTVWGLTNAMTDFLTHKKRKETAHANDSAFMSVTFDTTALNRFLEIATSMAR
jgi:phage/plasmid-like protein (TIGR03299 family)